MGPFGNKFAFTIDTENAYMAARKGTFFHAPILRGSITASDLRYAKSRF